MVTLFAVGVITGTVLSFEMGLLWPNFTGTFGSVFGLGFAVEGFSFFMEAILPGLTIDRAAAGHDALVWVVIVVLGGGVILFPSLGLLFRLALTGRFADDAQAALRDSPAGEALPPDSRSSLPVRVAGVCLIAGVGSLNVANTAWAHAIGVALLCSFVVLAFRAIIFTVLDDSQRHAELSAPLGAPARAPSVDRGHQRWPRLTTWSLAVLALALTISALHRRRAA